MHEGVVCWKKACIEERRRNVVLLTITNTSPPATDIGYLLHKNPARCQEVELSFGKAQVFYPEATPERCTAALLLDVDPVEMVRGRTSAGGGLLDQYVNDRPYVASSFLSVAIAQVFGSALNGRCQRRPDLVEKPLPLQARLSALPCRGGEVFLRRLFEPLGYTMTATRHPLDPQFPEWGDGPYHTVELQKTTTLQDLLVHLYVLVPVLDGKKHYFVGEAEVENLLRKGEGWLAAHPEKEGIALRYLRSKPSLARMALARLADEAGETTEAAETEEAPGSSDEVMPQREASLNDQRLGSVLAALRGCGAKRVLDLGCGEGKLLSSLLKDQAFTEIVGMDVSIRSLEIAERKLNLERLPEARRKRIRLIQGSLIYRDVRLAGFDAAAIVEVLEHLEPERLAAFERVLFECTRPANVVLTTPNREYNSLFEGLQEGTLRHRDHRFEWTRAEFQDWGSRVALRWGYSVRFIPVGPEDPDRGPPTQMAIFQLEERQPVAERPFPTPADSPPGPDRLSPGTGAAPQAGAR
jgi:3' terminal RNA ribose 2'-O-methyltransferase Hen1